MLHSINFLNNNVTGVSQKKGLKTTFKRTGSWQFEKCWRKCSMPMGRCNWYRICKLFCISSHFTDVNEKYWITTDADVISCFSAVNTIDFCIMLHYWNNCDSQYFSDGSESKFHFEVVPQPHTEANMFQRTSDIFGSSYTCFLQILTDLSTNAFIDGFSSPSN